MADALSHHFAVPLVPWGAVAADVTPGAGGEGTRDPCRAFCFLPLPALTGLPVHVNGFFELSSNRRDIWWGEMSGAVVEGCELSHDTDRYTHWNLKQ